MPVLLGVEVRDADRLQLVAVVMVNIAAMIRSKAKFDLSLRRRIREPPWQLQILKEYFL